MLYTIGSGSYGRCQKVRRKSDGKVSTVFGFGTAHLFLALDGRRLLFPFRLKLCADVYFEFLTTSRGPKASYNETCMFSVCFLGIRR